VNSPGISDMADAIIAPPTPMLSQPIGSACGVSHFFL
jgi:hypothetical protein